MKKKLVTLDKLERYTQWLNAAIEAVQTALSGELEDPSEVAAAALNELNTRLKNIEERLQSVDYLKVDKLRVLREFTCPALAEVAFSGKYSDLSGRPTLATVATTGNYNDLSNKPSIPTVPANVSAFNNDAGYTTEAALSEVTEVAAAALVETHQMAASACEQIEDGFTTKRMEATKEVVAPNINNIEFKALGAQSSSVSVLFDANQRRYRTLTASANITLYITARNTGENYLFIANTSNSDIAVSVGGVNALANSAIYRPEGNISIPAGKAVEVSIIVFGTAAYITLSDVLVQNS